MLGMFERFYYELGKMLKEKYNKLGFNWTCMHSFWYTHELSDLLDP